VSWIGDQSHHDYHSLRPKSSPHYIYGKAAYGELINLPAKMSINFLTRLQIASTNLLPSEQFGLGGYDTVRGYEERLVNADNALCMNLELHSPKWKVFGNWWKVQDEFLVLAFIDYGLGKNCHPIDNEHLTQSLIGIGPGIRYSIGPYLSARLDYGFPLHKTQFQQQMKPQLHVGVTLSY
jgi:hemolysin activation/secretion protein